MVRAPSGECQTGLAVAVDGQIGLLSTSRMKAAPAEPAEDRELRRGGVAKGADEQGEDEDADHRRRGDLGEPEQELADQVGHRR